MIVSVTECMAYMRCRRQWNYTSYNRMSLAPAMSAPHFAVGTCVHGALEDWLKDPDSDLSLNYTARAAEAIKSSVDRYRSLVGADPSPSELVSLFEALQMGKAMMTNYQAHYKTPIDYKQYHLVEAEQTICIPIPDSYSTCQVCEGTGSVVEADSNVITIHDRIIECSNCHGLGRVPNYLEGTLDGVIADKRDRLLVLEHKTYGSRPNVISLNMNFQFIAYQWLLTKMDVGPVLGLAYDGMWKRDGTGRNQTPNELFLRAILTRNKAEIAEFETELSHIVTEMSNDPFITHTVPWNGCFDCGMIQLCTAQSKHENYQSLLSSRYIKRERTSAFLEDAD